MKLYDLVKDIMINNPYTRNSDKELIWVVLVRKGFATDNIISKENFKRSPTFESITRARRKVQELHPELQATRVVKDKRTELSRGKPIDIFSDLI